MMDEFFKSIKDNLENRKTPEFKPEAWQGFVQRAQQVSAGTDTIVQKPLSSRRWILALVLALLLGSMILNYQQFKNAKAIESLVEHSQKTASFNAQDTISTIQYIHRVDTIYLVKDDVPQSQGASNTLSVNALKKPSHRGLVDFPTRSFYRFNKKLFQDISSDLFPSGEKSAKKNKLNFFLSSPPKTTNSSFEKTDIIQDHFSTALSPLDLLPLHFLEKEAITIEQLTSPFADLNTINKRKKKTLRQVVFPMRPKGFSLAVNGGVLASNHSDIEGEAGFILGLQPHLIFNKNFRLFGEFSFAGFEYSTDRVDKSIGAPPLQEQLEDFELQQIQVQQQYFQFGIGLQYRFYMQHAFHPFLGVGWYNLQLLPYEIKYELKDLQNNNTLTLDKEVNQRKLVNNQLFLQSGIDYQLGVRWGLRLEAFYRQNLNAKEISSPSAWGGRLGLFKDF